MSPYLLIDYNAMAYRGCFSAKDLYYEEKFTGGFYSFLTQLCKQINEYKPSKLFICKDFPPYKRSLLYPEYKKDRVKDIEIQTKIKESRKYINGFLQILNIHIYEEKGLEADDIIGLICLYNLLVHKIIISNDSDLFQLLELGVTLIRKDISYTEDAFVNEYGIQPSYWPLVIALAGGHNGVPGLDRIGIKTALKIVKDVDKFQKIYEENKDKILLYEKLATLPITSETTLFKQEHKKIEYNEREVIKYLALFGISVTQAMETAFTQLAER